MELAVPRRTLAAVSALADLANFDPRSVRLGIRRELGARAFRIDCTTQCAVVGGDADALIDGFGRLLRARSLENFAVRHNASDELWRLRGHQITLAHHASQFRTWAEFRQFALALRAFGTNQLEAAHLDGLSPADFDDALRNFSSAVDAAAMNVSIWWPCGLGAGRNLTATFARMPRLDSLFFPGGDGGALNLTLIGATMDAARASHPDALAAADREPRVPRASDHRRLGCLIHLR